MFGSHLLHHDESDHDHHNDSSRNPKRLAIVGLVVTLFVVTLSLIHI